MAKGIIVAADGAEETEFVALYDILARAGIYTDIVTLKEESFETSHGLRIKGTKTIDAVDYKDYDFICLPGGKRGTDNIGASKEAMDLVKKFNEEGKLVAAICAAPSLLGKLGILEGKRYTCFPGFETEGGTWMDAGAVEDGLVITGRSMYYTIPFAELIVKHYLGEEGLSKIFGGTRGIA